MARKHKDYLTNYGSRVIITKGPQEREQVLRLINSYFMIFRENPDYITFYFDDRKPVVKSVLAYMVAQTDE